MIKCNVNLLVLCLKHIEYYQVFLKINLENAKKICLNDKQWVNKLCTFFVLPSRYWLFIRVIHHSSVYFLFFFFKNPGWSVTISFVFIYDVRRSKLYIDVIWYLYAKKDYTWHIRTIFVAHILNVLRSYKTIKHLKYRVNFFHPSLTFR